MDLCVFTLFVCVDMNSVHINIDTRHLKRSGALIINVQTLTWYMREALCPPQTDRHSHTHVHTHVHTHTHTHAYTPREEWSLDHNVRDDERWGAGVEYRFQEFNEPYAPS